MFLDVRHSEGPDRTESVSSLVLEDVEGNVLVRAEETITNPSLRGATSSLLQLLHL